MSPTDGKTEAEPTMEEILASIRRIIADEKEPSSAESKPHEEDVLELTQMVQEDGSIVDLSAPPSQAPKVEPAPVEQPIKEPPAPPQPEPSPPPTSEGGLISDAVAAAASSSLSSLVSTVQIERMAAAVPMTATPLGQASKTLEDMIEELIRPMLKEWLDQNLASLVERLVQKEIERISKRVAGE